MSLGARGEAKERSADQTRRRPRGAGSESRGSARSERGTARSERGMQPLEISARIHDSTHRQKSGAFPGH